MILAIIGSRTFTDYDRLVTICDSLEITGIVSGGARGADSLAEKYAKERNIPLTVIPADWEKYGRSAGFIRNTYIVEKADEVLAFWDGKSPGTKHSIELAKKLGKKTNIQYVHTQNR